MRLTDPIPMVMKNWYSLLIQGERRHSGSADAKHGHTTRITLRIDPAEHVRESIKAHPKGYLTPWAVFSTSMAIDFKDIYSLGNTFDNQCSDATDDIEWSLGPLRNFELYGLNKRWVSGSVGKRKLVVHEPVQPDQTASDGFDSVPDEPEELELYDDTGGDTASLGQNQSRSQNNKGTDLLHQLAQLSKQAESNGSRPEY
eukprot:COSAG06_NODE_5969_length_3178_cov_21.326405_1_plen_199_part_10